MRNSDPRFEFDSIADDYRLEYEKRKRREEQELARKLTALTLKAADEKAKYRVKKDRSELDRLTDENAEKEFFALRGERGGTLRRGLDLSKRKYDRALGEMGREENAALRNIEYQKDEARNRAEEARERASQQLLAKLESLRAAREREELARRRQEEQAALARQKLELQREAARRKQEQEKREKEKNKPLIPAPQMSSGRFDRVSFGSGEGDIIPYKPPRKSSSRAPASGKGKSRRRIDTGGKVEIPIDDDLPVPNKEGWNREVRRMISEVDGSPANKAITLISRYKLKGKDANLVSAAAMDYDKSQQEISAAMDTVYDITRPQKLSEKERKNWSETYAHLLVSNFETENGVRECLGRTALPNNIKKELLETSKEQINLWQNIF